MQCDCKNVNYQGLLFRLMLRRDSRRSGKSAGVVGEVVSPFLSPLARSTTRVLEFRQRNDYNGKANVVRPIRPGRLVNHHGIIV